MKPINKLVQQDGAIQDRSIFWDEDIYQKEMMTVITKQRPWVKTQWLSPVKAMAALKHSLTHVRTGVTRYVFQMEEMQRHLLAHIMVGYLVWMEAWLMCL